MTSEYACISYEDELVKSRKNCTCNTIQSVLKQRNENVNSVKHRIITYFRFWIYVQSSKLRFNTDPNPHLGGHLNQITSTL